MSIKWSFNVSFSIRIGLSVLCFILLVQWAKAQMPLPDSIAAQLDLVKTDSAKITLLLNHADQTSGIQPALSKRLSQEVIRDSTRCSDQQLYRAYTYLGYAYFDQNQYDSALTYFRRAKSKTDRDTEQIRIIKIMSDCHRYMGNYNDAFEVAFDGLKIANANNIHAEAGFLYNKIGELYREQNETKKAIEFLQNAYQAFSLADNERGMLSASVNTALAYKQEDAEKALVAYENVLEEFNHLFNSWDSARIYSNLANINLDLNQFVIAEDYLMKALKCHEKIDKPMSRAYCYKELGELYVRTNQPEKVITFASQALQIAREIQHFSLQYQSSKQLSDAYSALGNHHMAYKHLQDFWGYQDSIRNQEKIEFSKELEAKYANEQKEQQIYLQQEQLARQQLEMNKELLLRNALLIGFILVAIIGMISYRNAKLQEQKREELQKFTAQIQELQATQSRWFTNIAHELRTPLTLILGPIKQLLGNQEVPTHLKKEVSLAKKYGDLLVDRVNEILEISRLESGKLVLHQQPTNLVKMLKLVNATFQSLASQKEIELELNSPTDTLVLNIDPDKIVTILNNLVSNALKFTPVNGSVHIELREGPQGVHVQVVDSGIGISSDDIDLVFDRFYQGPKSRQKQFGGSGVGLTLSQELAKLHGGLITVTSEPNSGSTFTLTLPGKLKCEEVKEPEYPSEPEETDTIDSVPFNSHPTKSQAKILLVEDHPDMREYIVGILETYFDVEEATDGQQGLEKLTTFKPDLIISDIKMPGMDGLTFAKKVKEDNQLRLTPFICLTAHANEKDKITALTIGVDDYLVKPFDSEELLARIHNLITNASARKRMLEELTEENQKELTMDQQMMLDLKQLVATNLSDSSFSVSELARLATMSTSTLSRNVKAMTGLTPGQFIREVRLSSALDLFESQRYGTIAEVVYAVGFEDQSSFSRLFKKRFGKSPTSYVNR